MMLRFFTVSLWMHVLMILKCGAAINILAQEQGANVRISYSGSIDLSGAVYRGKFNYNGAINPPRIIPQNGWITALDGPVDYYSLVSRFPSFGLGAYSAASYFSGDGFAIDVDLYLDAGYVSCQPLEGEIFFPDTTFQELGIQPGVYTATVASDFITLSVVPEPSGTLFLLLSTFILCAIRGRRSTG